MKKTDVIPIMIIQKVWSVNFKPVTTQYQLSCPFRKNPAFSYRAVYSLFS